MLLGLGGMLYALPLVGRAEEAGAIADETLAVARAYGNPFWISFALDGYGRAFAESQPDRALEVLREGLDYAREHRLPLSEAFIGRDVAALEAVHGEVDRGAWPCSTPTSTRFHRAGNVTTLATTLANLAMFFDRFGRPEIAATIYGSAAHHASISSVIGLPAALVDLRAATRRTGLRRVRLRRDRHGARGRRAVRPPADPSCPPPGGGG